MSIEFYPFELHAHTLHSDGRFTPEELALRAAAEGLKGFALTDHNTSTGNSYAERASAQHNLAFISGIEWTTFFGHITALGGDFGIDWRAVNPKTVCRQAACVKEAGGCVGIAHPFRIGFPICTGGSDDWGIQDYKDFTHYEIWSGPNPHKEPTNVFAEERYRELTALGNRLACVYGRDWHSAESGVCAATFLGIEGEVTAAKALEAIKKGRSYVSLGIKADISLCDGKRVYYIGESVPEGEYELSVTLTPPSEGLNALRVFGIEGITLYTQDSVTRIGIEGGRHSKKLRLGKGFLQVTVEGSIDSEGARLAVATPFYIN